MPKRANGRCRFIDDCAEESGEDGCCGSEDGVSDLETEQDRAGIDDSVQKKPRGRKRRVVITQSEEELSEDDLRVIQENAGCASLGEKPEESDDDSVYADSDESDISDSDRGFVRKSKAEKQAKAVEVELKRMRREAGAIFGGRKLGRTRVQRAFNVRFSGVAGVLLKEERAPGPGKGGKASGATAAETRRLLAADSFYSGCGADDGEEPVQAKAGGKAEPVQAKAGGKAEPVSGQGRVKLIPVQAKAGGKAGLASIFQRCQARQGGGKRVDLTRETVDLTKPRVHPTPKQRELAPLFRKGFQSAPSAKKGKTKEEPRECVVRNARTGAHEYVDKDGKRTPCD
jgi:hypothetical protein